MGRMILTLPRLGETMEEARVTDWLVTPGTAYKRGDVLLEVETDKTVVEVPALADGVLLAHLVAAGDMVDLDQPIAEVEAEGAETSAAPKTERVDAPMAQQMAPPKNAPLFARRPTDRIAASPAARAAARTAGLDLALLTGSGRRGRIMAGDVRAQSAPTVVLLHGLFDTAKGWRDLPKRLRDLGHRVHAPDLPGHGAEAKTATTLDGMTGAISADLPDGPLILIGHSLGAAIATRLALDLGARVSKLILIAPAGIGARINPDFTDGMLSADTPDALGGALGLLDAGPISPSALTQEFDRLISLRAVHAQLSGALARKGIQQIDITGALAALACPISVIFGTSDRIMDWHDIANLPSQAAIHLVRGAGHLPHLSAPGLIGQLIGGKQAPHDRRVFA